MNKALTYTGFIIAALAVVLAFVTATTYTQLAVAVVLYPALAYFGFKILARKHIKTPVITIQMPTMPARKVVEVERKQVDVADIDKRTFLKLIGAAGVSFFLFSILGRRVDSLLFGGNTAAPAPAGGGISSDSGSAGPITSGYRISEIDEGAVTYYGFIDKNGAWLIMREDTQTSSFRYAKGDLNFPAAWANRQNLKYDYYYNLH